MKNYGKIINYNGSNGTIRGIDGNDYLVLNTDLVDKDIKVADYVTFDKEVYEDVEFTKLMARFVKKLEKK